MEQFDEGLLKSELEVLRPYCWTVFGISIAERLLPNYRLFSVQFGWGDAAVLRAGLDFVWDSLASGSVDVSLGKKIRDSCFELAPDADDFDTILASSAMDAANSAARLVDLVLDPKVSIAIEMAIYGRDTVDMFVQELEDLSPSMGNLEQFINAHPLMQKELVNQREALELVKSGVGLAEAMSRWRGVDAGSIQ